MGRRLRISFGQIGMACCLVARGKGSCSSLHARCREPAWRKSPRELRRVRVTLRAREGPLRRRRLNEGMRIVLEDLRSAAMAAWIMSVLEARWQDWDQTNDRSKPARPAVTPARSLCRRSPRRRHPGHTLNWSLSCWQQPMQPACKPKLPKSTPPFASDPFWRTTQRLLSVAKSVP